MFAAVFLAALAACTKEQELYQGTEQNQDAEAVLATGKDFVAAVETRTVITQSGSNAPTFAWKAGDVIGIIPMNNETVQSNYKVKEVGSNPKKAAFDGGVWALKEGKEYSAYYPFNEKIARSGDNLEFSFLGQTQSANNSLEHLGAYDYMYAGTVVPRGGSAQFDFEHKISLVRLQLTVPKADTYTRVVLESTESWFASEASLKLSDGTMTATETMKYASISLNNIQVSANGILTVWFAALPTSALSGKSLSVKLFGDGNTCTGEITGITAFNAGSAYSYAVTLSSGGQEVEYVDLGLPSGLKWASCNLGASKPEEYGGYYQWGGLEDVTDTSIYLDWSNCPYHTGSYSYGDKGWTKYIPSNKSSYWSGSGKPDNKTILDPEDDVAHVKLGGKWRMPTESEFNELRNNCQCSWVTYKGVKGYKFTSKKSGYTDKWIFLPAAGYRRGDCLYFAGSYGDYWSSSLDTDCPNYACYVGFDSGDMDTDYYDRSDGQSVRPVSE